MAKVLEINGEHFVLASFAAKQVGYTSDYVARIAREKKILATKVGRQWFVSLKSLNSFVLEANEEKNKRREILSVERKIEKSIYAKNISTEKNISFGRSKMFLAVAQTATVLILGVVIGTGGYVFNTNQTASLNQFKSLSLDDVALSVYEFFSIDDYKNISITPTISDSDDGVFVDFENLSNIYEEEDSMQKTLSQQVFSDEVDVVIEDREDSNDITAITPKLKNVEGKTQRFFMVPVTESGDVRNGFEDLFDGVLGDNADKN